MPSRKFFKKKAKEHEQIANERINILFSRAGKEYSAGRQDLADRYVELTTKLAMKVNLSMPKKFRKKYCKKCLSYLKIGDNASVRLKTEKQALELKCFVCGYVRRWGYKKN